VPKATVNKDDLFSRNKNEVRFAWKILVMEFIAIAHGMD
jgi:hypothetical protein